MAATEICPVVERLKITGLIPHIVSSPSQLIPSEIGLDSIYIQKIQNLAVNQQYDMALFETNLRFSGKLLFFFAGVASDLWGGIGHIIHQERERESQFRNPATASGCLHEDLMKT